MLALAVLALVTSPARGLHPISTVTDRAVAVAFVLLTTLVIAFLARRRRHVGRLGGD